MTETAVFGGGCFWCTEAIFKMLKGVESVEPGYAGGESDNPNYQHIDGHAEVIQIKFDPKKVYFTDLMTVFFATHDPTALNRQGADIGTQYRSVVLYKTSAQKEIVEKFIDELNNSSQLGEPVVTEVKSLLKFYKAEDFHRNFYGKNKDNPYCQVVINPKLAKVKEKFAKLLGEN